MTATRWFTCFLLFVLNLLACPMAVAAYPDQTVRLVVPFAAGGSTDVVARLLAEKLAGRLGKAVIIENRPGAGGNIGAQYVAHAAPDGYTLVLGTISTHGINPTLYRNVSPDAARQFAPIALLVSTPNLLLVPFDSPIHSVAELIAAAKARTEKLSYASAGVGTSGHLMSELFSSETGIKMVHIPYRGSSQAVIGLMSGQAQMTFDNVPFELPYVQSHKLRALAITALKRSPLLPDVPTMSELGIHGFEFGAWYALLAPAHTPDAIITRLNDDVNEILASPDFKAKLPGIEILGGTPQRAQAFIDAEVEKWRKVVRSINLKPE